MAHFHIKTKKGRPYLYVREIARVDGKPKVISQSTSALRNESPVSPGTEPDIQELKVEEFGALWLPAKSTGISTFAASLIRLLRRRIGKGAFDRRIFFVLRL